MAIKHHSNETFLDSNKLIFGTGDDLEIYHDGTNSVINNTTGDLQIYNNANDKDVVFLSDDGSGGTSIYMMLDGSEKTTNVDVPLKVNDQIILGSKGAYSLPAQGTRMRTLQIEDHTSCRVYLDSSENSYHQPIVLDIFYRAQYATSKPQIIKSESYEWHLHSNDIIFTSDQAGTAGADSYIYFEKVSYSTGRTVNIRKIEVFDGAVTVLDGSTTDTNGGTDETIVSTFSELNLGDNDKLKIGDGSDLQIYHDATDSWINNANGDLLLVQNANDKDIVFYCDDGSGGVTAYLALDGSAETVEVAKPLNITGNTAITGHLDVTASSASGSPLIRFNQTTTRRGFIQMADTNNNLRVASEYGSVSLEAASSEGSDSDTSYIRIQPGGTVEIGAVDGDATIATDGNMTFRIDADNDETSQKFAFQNNASTEIASLDESGNLSLDGGIELGNASDTTIARSAAGKVTIEGAPIQTTQIVTSHHNMSLDGGSSTVDYYFPINSLADGSSSSLYYTRVLPAYDGKVVKMLFRGSNNMGSSCTINMSRRAHDGTSTSHQTSGFQATETFNGATKTTVVVPCGVGGSNAADWVFEEGDQLGFSLVKNTTATNVDLVVTIVYEYTIS